MSPFFLFNRSIIVSYPVSIRSNHILPPHTAFAHDGTPNNPQVPNATTWPSYGPSGGKHMVFQGFNGGSFVEQDDFRQAGIELINNNTAKAAKMLSVP
jgi:hypothetical protein